MWYKCAKEGCDPRQFQIADRELDDYGGQIRCEHCYEPCVAVSGLVVQTRAILGQREDYIAADHREAIGPDWLIFNAPRPIYGHITWENTLLGAWFYGAVNPHAPEAAYFIRENISLDARALVCYTEEQVRRETQAYYDHNYPQYALKVADHPLRDAWVSFLRVCHNPVVEVALA